MELRNGIFLLSCILLAGCFYFGKDNYEDVLRHPSSDWSSRDCLTVVLSVMANNFNDPSTCIRVIATPYYPAVIAAVNRIAQQRTHMTEEDFERNMDTLLKAEVGLFMDWNNGRLIDARGNYYREKTQIDSLMFLVTVQNTSTCIIPQVAGVNITNQSDWPCYIPDITDLERNIELANDRGMTLRPRYVWGKRHNMLTQDETLLVMFPLRGTSGHFLDGSENFYLIVQGFVQDIKLQFSVSDIR